MSEDRILSEGAFEYAGVPRATRGLSKLLRTVNSRPLTQEVVRELRDWSSGFLDHLWRPDLLSELASQFPSGSRLATPEQVLAERLSHAVNLVAWAQGRLPGRTVRVEGMGELDKAFALATAVRLLGAVPHLWANDVRNAVAEMAASATTPLPAHVLVSDVIPEAGMWWTWETDWSDPQDPMVNTQGVLLHPLPALNRSGELHRSAFAATQLQSDANGHAVVRPGLLGRFGDCYPENFPAGSGYELIARFLAFLNSSYIPEEESLARRQARRWAERQGIPDLMADSVRFVLLRRQARDRHESIGAEREHRHRWLVSGHFRNQWCPSEQTHKIVWIEPHVKGPADAPLMPRIYRVSR